jgi:hypothetical protein
MSSAKTRENRPERGVPFAVKRQLLILVLLLAIVTVLGYQLHEQAGLRDDAVRGTGSPGATSGGDGRAPSGIGTPAGEWTPLAPRPPEPFVPRDEVLARAKLKDRTSDIDEEAALYLFHRILAEPGVLAAEPPALSLAAAGTPEPLDAPRSRKTGVFHSLIESPDLYRGRVVEVKGILVQVEGESPLQLRGLEFPNPTGRDRCFQSYLYGTDDKFYLVATLNRRDDIEHRQGVRLRGYFSQLYTGDVLLHGEKARGTIPFLVGEDYEIVTNPVPEGMDLTLVLPLGILLLLATVYAIYVANARARRSFEERRKAGRERGRHAASAEPDPASPGAPSAPPGPPGTPEAPP